MKKVAYTRQLTNGEIVEYDDEGINYDDIPEITDFTNWKRKPEIAERIKDGYTIIIEYDGYIEIRKYDFTKIPRTPKGDRIPYEVVIEKRERQEEEITNLAV